MSGHLKCTFVWLFTLSYNVHKRSTCLFHSTLVLFSYWFKVHPYSNFERITFSIVYMVHKSSGGKKLFNLVGEDFDTYTVQKEGEIRTKSTKGRRKGPSQKEWGWWSLWKIKKFRTNSWVKMSGKESIKVEYHYGRKV